MDPFCPSVRLSVREHDNCPQFQDIDLKLSTQMFFEPKHRLSSKMGKIGIKKIHVMGTSSKPILGLWGKNKFCPNELKFGTLAFLVIKNDF